MKKQTSIFVIFESMIPDEKPVDWLIRGDKYKIFVTNSTSHTGQKCVMFERDK